MALLEFQNIGMAGIAACIPKNIIDNYAYTQYFPAEDVKEVVDKIGIKQRRFASADICSSDMCFAAAEKLIAEMGINREEIDLLLFVSQTPDYRMPATSVILQERLKLPNTTAAFDINLGCSAFIYGLTIAYSYLQQPGINKVLLLDGETRSRIYSPKDRTTAFLFGDAGVAALLEKGDKYGKSWFSLNSDGSREDFIKMKAGGYRYPSSPETFTEKVIDEHGNIRSDEHGFMNGADVFNFVIREIPKDAKRILEFAGLTIDQMDYYLFHQANNFMNDYLVKKLKLDVTKVPSSIEKFGNTSSVSLPLTLASELKDKLNGNKQLLLSAFGVGLTWAHGIINVNNCFIPDIVEI